LDLLLRPAARLGLVSSSAGSASASPLSCSGAGFAAGSEPARDATDHRLGPAFAAAEHRLGLLAQRLRLGLQPAGLALRLGRLGLGLVHVGLGLVGLTHGLLGLRLDLLGLGEDLLRVGLRPRGGGVGLRGLAFAFSASALASRT
jgi:hypothetical protein